MTMPQPTSDPDIKASPRAGAGAAWPWIAIGVLIAVTVGALRVEGRRWWCACEAPWPWASDVWSRHCSQHLVDPYSFTHLAHGLIFCGALAWAFPRWRVGWRLCGAVTIAAAWEVLENSPLIIDRYRTATMSLDYLGDSVINALGDILSCVAGFFIAQRFGLRRSLVLFVAMELVLLLLIRDNLTLNVLMLIWPVEAVKVWQTVGHGGG